MQQVDKENMYIFANCVKKLRKKECISLNKFVMTRGFLTTATWSRIENGKFDIKLSTLLRVAKMLDIPVDKLLRKIDFSYEFTEE